jgi:hypothetical protein
MTETQRLIVQVCMELEASNLPSPRRIGLRCVEKGTRRYWAIGR